VAALCFAAIAGFALVDSDRSARQRIGSAAAIAANELALQQNKLEWMRGQVSTFPDLQVVAGQVLAPGLCLAYRAPNGEMQQRLCVGEHIADAPSAFVAIYGALFRPGREAAVPVIFRGRRSGDAVAWGDPTALTAQAWHSVHHLLAAMCVTLLLLSLLVYAALARALRPTQAIRAGIARIAADDLSVRDDERRHLARELHDEFGQNLAAIRALAAAGQTQECASIGRTATEMAETLRNALFRLRPPEADELGLAASLEGLVEDWNGHSCGRTRFEIRLDGGLESLPAQVGTSLYRIAQEALTNAAKHAGATRVTLALALRPSEIELTVDDDGRSGGAERSARGGLGLLGMRERVDSLGGRMRFDPGHGAGSSLRVVIPVDCAA
jgi:signal transduction histidine kinase